MVNLSAHQVILLFSTRSLDLRVFLFSFELKAGKTGSKTFSTCSNQTIRKLEAMMSTQFLKLDFEDIDSGEILKDFPGPLSYYLLLRRYIWRSPHRPEFRYAPPAHSAFLDGKLVAVLSDKKAASILGKSTRTIGRYRKELLEKQWIIPVKPTNIREVRMWWLGYWEDVQGDYGKQVRVEAYFCNAENLPLEISTPGVGTNEDTTDMSHQTIHLSRQRMSDGSTTHLSGNNREVLNREPLKEIEYGSRAPSAREREGDVSKKPSPLSSSYSSVVNNRLEIEDRDFGEKALSKLASYKFPKSELSKKVFRIRRQKIFPSKAAHKAWMEIEVDVTEGVLIEDWVIHVAKLSSHPSNTADGASYSGSYPGTFYEFLTYVQDSEEYRPWLESKGLDTQLATEIETRGQYADFLFDQEIAWLEKS